MEKIGKLAVGSILMNIKAQQQADGTALKRNAPSTILYKQKHGIIPLSLVAWGQRLIKQMGISFIATTHPTHVIVEPSPAPLPARKGPAMAPRDLSRFVQLKGYVGWFGLNIPAKEAIREVIRKAIVRALRAVK